MRVIRARSLRADQKSLLGDRRCACVLPCRRARFAGLGPFVRIGPSYRASLGPGLRCPSSVAECRCPASLAEIVTVMGCVKAAARRGDRRRRKDFASWQALNPLPRATPRSCVSMSVAREGGVRISLLVSTRSSITERHGGSAVGGARPIDARSDQHRSVDMRCRFASGVS